MVECLRLLRWYWAYWLRTFGWDRTPGLRGPDQNIIGHCVQNKGRGIDLSGHHPGVHVIRQAHDVESLCLCYTHDLKPQGAKKRASHFICDTLNKLYPKLSGNEDLARSRRSYRSVD